MLFLFFSTSAVLELLFIHNFNLDFFLPTKYCELCFYYFSDWLLGCYSPRLSRCSVALLTSVTLLEGKKGQNHSEASFFILVYDNRIVKLIIVHC